MVSASIAFERNAILAALSPADREHLSGHFRHVQLEIGRSINEPLNITKLIYFPLDCVISVFNRTQEGRSVEIAMVGREGCLGSLRLLEDPILPMEVLPQGDGHALVMSAAHFANQFATNPVWRQRAADFKRAALAQIIQLATCNRLHTVRERLCRRILLSLNRLEVDELRVSQSFLAKTLGVRRESVTLVLDELHSEGLIEHKRDYILVLNRTALEASSCECYSIIRREYLRFAEWLRFPHLYATA